MNKAINKVSRAFKDVFRKHIIKILETHTIPIVKEIIIEDYELMLNSQVTDARSRTRPDDYFDEFVEQLNEFEYIEEDIDVVSLLVPDMDTFSFSGRLRVIQEILEGTVGSYVEVDLEQLEQIYSRVPTMLDVFDSSVRKKDRIVKLRKTVDVQNRLRANNIPIVDFPFSNTPPLNIFNNAKERVDKELLEESIEKALSEANKEFVNMVSK
jgi:hypothetical protein